MYSFAAISILLMVLFPVLLPAAPTACHVLADWRRNVRVAREAIARRRLRAAVA